MLSNSIRIFQFAGSHDTFLVQLTVGSPKHSHIQTFTWAYYFYHWHVKGCECVGRVSTAKME